MPDVKLSYSIQSFKYLIYRLFEISHRERNMSNFTVMIIVSFHYLFISSMIDFSITNYPTITASNISEGYNYINFFNIYQHKSLLDYADSFEAVTYLIFGIFIINMLICILIVYYRLNENNLILFLFRYLSILLEWVFILPMILILEINAHKYPTHVILIIILIVINFFLCYFNSISTVYEGDEFSYYDNIYSMLLFYIKYIIYLSKIINKQNYIDNTVTPLISTICIIYGIYKIVTFNNNKNTLLMKLNFIGFVFLLERDIISIVNFSLYLNSDGNPNYYYADYHIGSLVICILGFVFYNKVFIKSFKFYAAENTLESVNSLFKFIKFYYSISSLICEKKITKQSNISFLGLINIHISSCYSLNCPLKYKSYINHLTCDNFRMLENDEQEISMIRCHIQQEAFEYHYRRLNKHFDFNYLLIRFYIFDLNNYEKALIKIENLKDTMSLSVGDEFKLYLLKMHTNQKLIKMKNKEINYNNLSLVIAKQLEDKNILEENERNLENESLIYYNTNNMNTSINTVRKSTAFIQTTEKSNKETYNYKKETTVTTSRNKIAPIVDSNKENREFLGNPKMKKLNNKLSKKTDTISDMMSDDTSLLNTNNDKKKNTKNRFYTESLNYIYINNKENENSNKNYIDYHADTVLNSNLKTKSINNMKFQKQKQKQKSKHYTPSLPTEYFYTNLNLKPNSHCWSYLSVYDVLENDKRINLLKNLIFSALEDKENLWNLFRNNEIMVDEIYHLGENYFRLKEEIINCWEKIFENSNSSVDKSLEVLYICFMKVMFNIKLGRDSFITKNRKMFDINLLLEDDLYSKRFNDNVGILVINTNPKKNFQTISYINNAVLSILDYTRKNELIGKNLSIVQPDIIASIHTKLIKNFIEVGETFIQRKTLSLMMLNRNRNLVPVNLVISFLPSLDDSIEGICIFNKKNKEKEMVLTNEYGKIDSYTSNVGKVLSLQNGNNNHQIQSYIPETMCFDPSKRTYPEFFEADALNIVIKMRSQMLVPFSKEQYIKQYKVVNSIIEKNISSSHNSRLSNHFNSDVMKIDSSLKINYDQKNIFNSISSINKVYALFSKNELKSKSFNTKSYSATKDNQYKVIQDKDIKDNSNKQSNQALNTNTTIININRIPSLLLSSGNHISVIKNDNNNNSYNSDTTNNDIGALRNLTNADTKKNLIKFLPYLSYKVYLMKANFIRYEKLFIKLNLQNKLLSGVIKRRLFDIYKIMNKYSLYFQDYNKQDVTYTHSLYKIHKPRISLNIILRIIIFDKGIFEDKSAISGSVMIENTKSKETNYNANILMSSDVKSESLHDIMSVTSSKSFSLETYLKKIRNETKLAYSSLFSDINFVSLILATFVFGGLLLYLVIYCINDTRYSINNIKAFNEIINEMTVLGNYATLQLIKDYYLSKRDYDFNNKNSYKINFNNISYEVILEPGKQYSSYTNISDLPYRNYSFSNFESVIKEFVQKDYFIKNSFLNDIEISGITLKNKLDASIKFNNYEFTQEDIFNNNDLDLFSQNFNSIIKNNYKNSSYSSELGLYFYNNNTLSQNLYYNVFVKLVNYCMKHTMFIHKRINTFFLQHVYFSRLVASDLFELILSKRKRIYSIMIVLVSLNTIIICFCIYSIYLSYNKKNTKSSIILTLFQLIPNNQIDLIFIEINKFKGKFFTDFKKELSENYDLTAKITNINESAKTKQLIIIEKENEKISKRIVESTKLSYNFLGKVVMVVLFYFLYLIIYLVLSSRNYYDDKHIFEVQSNLFDLNLKINYLNYKTADFALKKLYFIEEKNEVNNIFDFWNTLTGTFNKLKRNIDKHSYVLKDKGEEIINRKVCKYVNLKFCYNIPSFRYINVVDYIYENTLIVDEELNNTNSSRILNSNSQQIDILNELTNKSIVNIEYNGIKYYNITNFMISTNEYYYYDYTDGNNTEYYENTDLFNEYDLINSTYRIQYNYIGYKFRNYQLHGLGDIYQKNLLVNKNLLQRINITSDIQRNLEYVIFNMDYSAKEVLLDNINQIFEYLNDNIVENYDEKYDIFLKQILILGICWTCLFAVLLYFMLKDVLNKMYRQETLSRRMLGEIPDFILHNNKQIHLEINNLLNDRNNTT